MKKALILLALFCCCVPVIAQEHETEHKLVQFQMVLLKRAPTTARGGIAPPLRRQHVGYYQSLLTSGKAIIAGPIQDDPEVSGVAIFNTKSADEARAWATAESSGKFRSNNNCPSPASTSKPSSG